MPEGMGTLPTLVICAEYGLPLVVQVSVAGRPAFCTGLGETERLQAICDCWQPKSEAMVLQDCWGCWGWAKVEGEAEPGRGWF